MTKTEIIKALSTKTGLSAAQAEHALSSLASIITDSVINDGSALIPGIGKLELTILSARTGRNPKTGEEITIAARRSVKFKAAKALKDAVA